MRPTSKYICILCGQPLAKHGIYLNSDDIPEDAQQGKWATLDIKGVYCRITEDILMATKQEILDVIVCAREKIADKHHWTTGVFARTKSSHKSKVLSPSAVRWCAVGAIYSCCNQEAVDIYVLPRQVIRYINNRLGYDNLVHINDFQGHQAVIDAFDSAIESLNREERTY